MDAVAKVGGPGVIGADEETSAEIGARSGCVNEGGARGVNVVGALISGGEGIESAGLAGRYLAAVMSENGIEGEFDEELVGEVEAEFEIGVGGGERFRIVGEIEAGGS